MLLDHAQRPDLAHQAPRFSSCWKCDLTALSSAGSAAAPWRHPNWWRAAVRRRGRAILRGIDEINAPVAD
jgi:hypothetical protein